MHWVKPFECINDSARYSIIYYKHKKCGDKINEFSNINTIDNITTPQTINNAGNVICSPKINTINPMVVTEEHTSSELSNLSCIRTK